MWKRIASPAQTPASVRTLDHAIDIHTYQPKSADALLMNEIGRVTVAFDRPRVALPYAQNRELGAFILIDQLSNETVALGLVRETTGVGPAPATAGTTQTAAWLAAATPAAATNVAPARPVTTTARPRDGELRAAGLPGRPRPRVRRRGRAPRGVRAAPPRAPHRPP